MRPRELQENKMFNYLQSYFSKMHAPDLLNLDSLEFLTNCAKISAFLQDEEACIKHLKTLNTLVKNEISTRDSTDVNALRYILENELAKVGFAPLFAKVNGYLPAQVFRELIHDKLLIKDVNDSDLSSSTPHGEFSHAIQWWLIVQEQAKNPSFLSKPVITVFTEFSEDKSIYKSRRSEEKRYLWDKVVDMLFSPPKEADFRSPENVVAYLTKTHDKELKILKTLLSCRTLKRKFEQTLDGFPSWEEKHKSSDGELGKHTIFKRKIVEDESETTLLIPIMRRTEVKRKTSEDTSLDEPEQKSQRLSL